MEDFLTPLSEGPVSLHETYTELLRAGFTEAQSMELLKVLLATAMTLAAGQME